MLISYREPLKKDGIAVHNLISNCPPLDKNSLYCNLLQCTDFSRTSIIAESSDGDVIGFISGYIAPESPETLFIWQVALDQQYRGKGVASQMLSRLFNRHKTLQSLKTTISPSNIPSQKLFQTFFENHGMTVKATEHFKAGVHLDSDHEDEILYVGTRMDATEATTALSSNKQHHHLTEVAG